MSRTSSRERTCASASTRARTSPSATEPGRALDGALNPHPLIVLVALLVVGVGCWLLGRWSARRRLPPLPADYYRALDHLVHDRLDRATEAFTRIAERDGDAIDLQFALGTLFRRRGETDRATRLHDRLKNSGPPHAQARARAELALDYLAAGLLDRAEQALQELAADAEHRQMALDRLVSVYELQGEWSAALRTLEQMPHAERDARRMQAVHCLCELAENALVQGDFGRVEAILRQGTTLDASAPRLRMLGGALAERRGDVQSAVNAYLAAARVAPELLLEALARVRALPAGESADAAIEALGRDLQSDGRLTARQWAVALAIRGIGEVVPSRDSDLGARYACRACGFQSASWYWRCPSCRTWDALRPGLLR